MIECFEDRDLMVERVHLLGGHRLLLDDLNCPDNPALASDALSHLAVGALGYQFSNLVVVFELSDVLLNEILLANLDFAGVCDDLLLHLIHFRFRVNYTHSKIIFL